MFRSRLSTRPARRPSLLLAASLSLLAAVAGCDDGNTDIVAVDCSAFGEIGTEATCEDLCPISNQAFCSTDAPELICAEVAPSARIEMCGVGLPKPPASPTELERSSTVEEFAGSGPPALGCYSPAGYPAPPGTPQMVTVMGIAKIFSAGCQSRDLNIEIYTVQRGGASDGLPGQLQGSAVTTAADCTIDGVPEDNDKCSPQRYECRFEYPDVPTETELMLVTDGALWAPLYEFNFFMRNEDVVAGAYNKDVRALAQDDYALIAQTALGQTITPGNGAVAGEVHDCEDVRLGNAIVDVDVPRLTATYFTDNEERPLPNLDARATSTLGLYAAMDIEPGPVTVAAAGLHDGKLVGVGYLRARVFADAVTSVTFRGLRPFQLP